MRLFFSFHLHLAFVFFPPESSGQGSGVLCPSKHPAPLTPQREAAARFRKRMAAVQKALPKKAERRMGARGQDHTFIDKRSNRVFIFCSNDFQLMSSCSRFGAWLFKLSPLTIVLSEESSRGDGILTLVSQNVLFLTMLQSQTGAKSKGLSGVRQSCSKRINATFQWPADTEAALGHH